MKFEILGVKYLVDFWWQIFCQFSPGKVGLKFVTENFTEFFTAKKNICHLELALGAFLPNNLFLLRFRKQLRAHVTWRFNDRQIKEASGNGGQGELVALREM